MVATMQNPAALPRERYAGPWIALSIRPENKQGKKRSFSPWLLMN
jgi:hypothetical protein